MTSTARGKRAEARGVGASSVQVTIAALIFAVLLLTEIGAVAFVYYNQRASLLEATDQSAYLNTQTLFLSLRNLMLNGEAPILVRTMADLRSINEFKAVDIYRRDGKLAFSDLDTLAEVNARLGKERFPPTPRIAPMEDDPEAALEVKSMVEQSLSSRRSASLIAPRRREANYFTPVDNLTDCMGCHGGDHPIRGVIHFRLSTAPAYRQIGDTRNLLIAFFIGVGLFLLVLLLILLRRVIIKPVLALEDVVSRVGAGDFGARVEFKRRDELGQLGSMVNAMTLGLEERFKLTKYVSSSTIERVRSGASQSDRRESIAVLFSDIRGFTSYAESHPPETVMRNLNLVLEAQAEAVRRHGGDVDKFVGDEVMAIFTDAPSALRCAADMLASVKRVDREIGEGLAVGVGISWGEVLRGHIGSAERREFAAIGDTVNLAARLCSAAKANNILVSEAFYGLVKDLAKAVELPNQSVKGKKEPITVYAISSLKATEA